VDGIVLTTATAQAGINRRFETPDYHAVRVTVTNASGAMAGDGLLIRTDQATGRIWGQVRDADLDNPLTNAKITMTDDNDELVRVTGTDGLGTFEFDNVPLGSYNLEAEAPEYASERVIVRLAAADQVERRDFRLSIPLGMERRKVKERLISELIDWPPVDWNLDLSPGAPYRQVEQNARSWLDGQTRVTEALMRLEKAEFAAKDAGDQALLLARASAEMWGALISQAVGIMTAIPYIDGLLNESRYGALYQSRHRMLKRIAWQIQKRYSRIAALGSWMQSRRGQHVLTLTFTHLLKPLAGSAQGAANLQVSSVARDILYRQFLREYGQATSPYPDRALSSAQGGGPYAFPFEDSKSPANTVMESANVKTRIALRTLETPSNVY